MAMSAPIKQSKAQVIKIDTLRFYFDEKALKSLRKPLSNPGFQTAIKTVRK